MISSDDNTNDRSMNYEDLEDPNRKIIYQRLEGWRGRLQSINEKWIWVEENILLLFISVMCLCAFSQWFLRAFYSKGYMWLGEFTQHTVLWSCFFGACIATSRLQHFRVDLIRLIKYDHKNIAKMLRVLSYIFAFVFCTVFAIASIKYVSVLYHDGSKTFYGLPAWEVYTVILYFYISSAIRFLFTIVIKISG